MEKKYMYCVILVEQYNIIMVEISWVPVQEWNVCSSANLSAFQYNPLELFVITI